MAGMITLDGVQLVLTGDFELMEAEDAKWKLISRGARVMTSVTKKTAAVIAGSGAKPKILSKAETHGTPVLDEAGLAALLEGTSLPRVLTMDRGATHADTPEQDLRGWSVSICGTLTGTSKGAVKAQLEGRGAKVVRKPSTRTDLLVLGDDLGFDAIEAMDDGVPFLKQPALTKLLEGAPLTDYVGEPTTDGLDDPAAAVLSAVAAKRAELVPDMAGEVWEETLSITLKPGGRVRVALIHLGGTPLHDHVRQVLQKERWPDVREPCSVEVPITFR